ncbi:DNA methyltransferase [Mycoplasma nasistruthionis]|uniref:Site-specific DNA-methyltransferase n=1 Tax=Mycoplasma nasistruthionis TaxID=353852 RepID=A0A5B7XVC1_9MOLU|nr:site-specific DNA-methyltransferase [Mycoplasma nasistruthionis]QCZ36712.1 site-specific DNA-methyltransferase [Mycoplasma nasistruthionis]
MKQNIFETVSNLLKTSNKYISENEGGEKLLKASVYSDVMKMDEELISLLLSDESVKQTFFKNVNKTLVFDKQKFAWFIESKEFLPDSYTAYTNKIGLAKNGNFINKLNDVVLDFPFKDCILQGGQDKDDQKRDEIFYHEIIANDQISNMLAPKVLSNAKRYKTDGVEEDIIFNENDNLIIKGNNLIALATLLTKYENKIKCIYIDPPYNTGKDSFNYNDRFNHSTWLTFMKNRLELAKKLLKDDGVIFVSLSDSEAHYCKVLMDDIFGVENFLNDIIWNSTKSVTNTALVSVSHTHTLVYFQNKDYYIKNRTEFRLKEDGEGFSNPDNDPRGPWKADPFQVGGWGPNQQYEIINPKTGVKYLPNEGCSWKNDYNKFQELLQDNRIVFGVNGEAGPQRKRFLYEAQERGRVAKTIWDDVGTTTNGTMHLKKLFGKNIFSNPKPEQLIERILELSTNENDVVLDFCLGSGTTAAVAHKMGRKYIGIEQMDYIQNITVERLKKVIEGEQGGISKSVNWQGGGSFVYCELLDDANARIKQIQQATEENIQQIKENIFSDERIVPYVIQDELEATELEFDNLSLQDKKNVLIKLIDKNKLYVNYSDINDQNYQISESDKKFTDSFYKGR